MLKEFFGDNLQDALSNASNKLGIDKEELSYSKLEGVFGSSLTGEKIGILVTYEKQESKNSSPAADELMAEFEKARGDSKTSALFMLEKILSSTGREVEISTEEKDDTVLFSVDFKGEKPDTRRGDIRELRGAVQYIINRVAGEGKEKRTRFIVDFNGDLEERKERMKEISGELSAFVKRKAKPIQIGLMDSQDRRLLHLALEGEKEIKTYSQGEGRFRVLCIEPRKRLEQGKEKED